MEGEQSPIHTKKNIDSNPMSPTSSCEFVELSMLKDKICELKDVIYAHIEEKLSK